MRGEPGKLERLIGLKPNKVAHKTPEDRQHFKAMESAAAVYREYTSNPLARPELFVYFISCPGKRIKIGFSVKPESRMRSIQTSMPLKLTLLGYVPGCAILEKMLHAHFAKRRVGGEWFRATPTLMREIDSLLDLWGKRVNRIEE